MPTTHQDVDPTAAKVVEFLAVWTEFRTMLQPILPPAPAFGAPKRGQEQPAARTPAKTRRAA